MALINEQQTRNFTAVSAIDVSGTKTPVMYMNANVDTSGSPSFSKRVDNMTLYFANREEIDGDYAAWEKKVFDELGR